MKQTPHIAAALVATFLAIVAAVAFTTYTTQFEQKYVHSVAGIPHIEIIKGSAIQRTALQQDDLLLVIGGSEVVLLDTKYEAYRLFGTYPTGFNVFNVANKGASALTMAQKVAALGDDVRGKKVVISITPAIVGMAPGGEVNTDHYAANFSQMHAMELAYSPYLSWETKQLAAKRMLRFADTLTDKPLLKFTLEKLASDSALDRAAYYLVYPLGKMQLSIVRMQDHYSTWDFIRHHSTEELTVTRKPEQIDWSALEAEAEKEQIENTDSNPYKVDNLKWGQLAELFVNRVPVGARDEEFMSDVDNALEWQDLEITLRVLKEMGVDAVIMTQPMNVPLWEAYGVSEQAQNHFYEKLHAAVEPYGYPVVDFQQYDNDPYFDMDLAAHTSRKGWIYVDQAYDDIFHDNLH